jgi:hypothetical protein
VKAKSARFIVAALGASALGIAVVCACSSASRPPPAETASEGGDRADAKLPPLPSDVVTVPQTDAPVCLGSPLEGPIVIVERTGEPPPEPKGGRITPGKYFLTAVYDYTGDGGRAPTSDFEQVALRVTETTMEFSEREGRVDADGGLSTDDQENKGVAYTTSGTSLFTRNECPIQGGEADRPYTATATELRIHASPVFVRVFTLQ